MSTIKTPTQDTWWIGRAEGMQPDQIVYAYNKTGMMLGCGQPIYEEYFNEEEWLNRLAQLGVILTEEKLREMYE